MAKKREELENPIIASLYTFRLPNPPAEILCKCGCGKPIHNDESYIVLDDNKYWDAEHAVKHMGGTWVFGGFDDAS